MSVRLRHPLALGLLAFYFAACQPQNCVRGSTVVQRACNDKRDCAPGQVRTCIDHCRALANEGEKCSAAPCTDSPACNTGLACVRDICKKTPFNLACTWSSKVEGQCMDGSFCRHNEGCPGLQDGPGTPLTGDMCLAFVSEGKLCDSDWMPRIYMASRVICSPCEPGTACVSAPDDIKRRCRRPCRDNAQCACGDRCFEAVSPSEKFCDHCVMVGARCYDEVHSKYACCNPDAECPTKDPEYENEAVCCMKRGAGCSPDEPCCGTDICVGGHCETSDAPKADGLCYILGNDGKSANRLSCVDGVNQRTITCKPGYWVEGLQGPSITVEGRRPAPGCVDIDECDVYKYSNNFANTLSCVEGIDQRTITCTPGFWAQGLTVPSVTLSGNTMFLGCVKANRCNGVGFSGKPANTASCVGDESQRIVTCVPGYWVDGLRAPSVTLTGTTPFPGCVVVDGCAAYGSDRAPPNTLSCVNGINVRTITCKPGFYAVAPTDPSITLTGDAPFAGCLPIVP